MVYAAYDPELDRRVALKLLKRQDGDGAADLRFQREAQALARLDHPNVVRVHELGVHSERLFIAMEFVEGETLGAWLAEAGLAPAPSGSGSGGRRARPWPEVLRVFDQAGRGLAAAHDVGLVHRDFKPENVMMSPDGRVRVMDFGLARFGGGEVDAGVGETGVGGSGSDLTQIGTIMGTPSYMSPEQFLAQAVDARSDQFSFCVALYEALYGERPFLTGPLAESIPMLKAAVLSGQVIEAPRGTAVPGWLRAVVVRGLARDPDARYPTMRALLEALADDPVRRRRRTLLRIGVALGVALTVWALIALALALGERSATIVEQAGEIELKNAALAERLAAETALLSAQRGHRAMMLIPEERESEALALAIEAMGAYVGDWTRAPREAVEALEQVLASDAVVLTPERVLEGHGDYLTGVRYSPDGTHLATISLDGTARIWDSAAGVPEEAPIAVLEGHQGGIYALEFSRDGALLATAGADGSVRLWESATGEALGRCEGHTAAVAAVIFSSSGDRGALITASLDGTARIWDPATCGLQRLLRDPQGQPVRALALSGDGSRIATAGGESAVIWDFASGDPLFTLAGHTGVIEDLDFSGDGARLATASTDASARIWSVTTGEEEVVLLGHRHRVSGVAFSPDDASVLTISWDSIVRVFDPTTGALRHELRGAHNAGLTALAMIPEGTSAVTTSFDGTIAVWDYVRGQHLARLVGHGGDVWGVDVSPDGRHVATAGVDRTARSWGLGYPKVAPQDGPEPGIKHVVLTPDGSHMVTIDSRYQARIWDTTRGTPLANLGEAEGNGIAASPDNRHVAAINRRTLAIFDRGSGDLRSLPSPGVPDTLVYTPDSRRLVVSGKEGVLWSVDAATGEVLATIDTGLEAAYFGLSPDGTRLASLRQGRPAAIWDLGGGALIGALGEERGTAPFVRWSPEGSLLATAGFGVVRLWDPETQVEVATCPGFRGFPRRLEFSKDGAGLVVVGSEGVWVWELPDCRPRFHYRPGGAIAKTEIVRFSDDGTKLVVLYENVVRVLSGDTGEILGALELRMVWRGDAYFRADDTQLLTLSEEGLRLWDLATGELLSRERIGVVRADGTIDWPNDPGELMGIACGRLQVDGVAYDRVRELCDPWVGREAQSRSTP